MGSKRIATGFFCESDENTYYSYNIKESYQTLLLSYDKALFYLMFILRNFSYSLRRPFSECFKLVFLFYPFSFQTVTLDDWLCSGQAEG